MIVLGCFVCAFMGGIYREFYGNLSNTWPRALFSQPLKIFEGRV